MTAQNDHLEPVNKGGRPPFEPTEHERMEVQRLSGLGLPKAQIAVRIRDGIAYETLVKYFKRELALGRSYVNEEVAASILENARSRNTRILIWWSKARMGWSKPAPRGKEEEETANLVTAVRRCIEIKGENGAGLPDESLAVKGDGT